VEGNAVEWLMAQASSEIHQPEFEFELHHPPAVCPLASENLIIFLWRMELM
jgi:hypothetical protein